MSLRKIVFILFGVIVIQFIISSFMPWADHADYHKNDTYSYYSYTDVNIKMPLEFPVLITLSMMRLKMG